MLINDEIRKVKEEQAKDSKNLMYYDLYLKYLHKMKKEYRISNNKFLLEEKIKREIDLINSREELEDRIITIKILLN